MDILCLNDRPSDSKNKFVITFDKRLATETIYLRWNFPKLKSIHLITRSLMHHLFKTVVSVILYFSATAVHAESIYPTVKLGSVPQTIQQLYKREAPNFTDKSHCATAWDSSTDGDKIAFKCSVFIKMSAEGERRAMRYCDEIREQKKISAPCRIIVE